MKILVHGYHDESKWFHNNYVPTMEEYMRVSLVTSAYSMLTAASFLGMDNVVTKEAFDWVSEKPRIIRASTIIGRLVNDIKSHKVRICYVHACAYQLYITLEFRYTLINIRVVVTCMYSSSKKEDTRRRLSSAT